MFNSTGCSLGKYLLPFLQNAFSIQHTVKKRKKKKNQIKALYSLPFCRSLFSSFLSLANCNSSSWPSVLMDAGCCKCGLELNTSCHNPPHDPPPTTTTWSLSVFSDVYIGEENEINLKKTHRFTVQSFLLSLKVTLSFNSFLLSI